MNGALLLLLLAASPGHPRPRQGPAPVRAHPTRPTRPRTPEPAEKAPVHMNPKKPERKTV